jgi:predicted lipoprotein with Yx(FWY)xxD motif
MRIHTDPLPGRPRPRTYARWGIVLGLVPAAAIAAACGGSSSTSSTTTTTAAAPSTSAATPAAVTSANNAKLGAILVDSQGRTLYTLTNNGAAVACTGGCLTIWPPALAPAGQATVTVGPGVSNVTAVSTSGGTQLAYKGLPLYRFAGDASAGSANGEGITSFGGTWHVVKTSGTSTGGTSAGGSGSTVTTAGGGTTTTASRGGGYGY